ncbi:MAG: nucleoside triphosphate pyrophosphohydrolase [Bacteriovoracaceae bacterium]
MNYPELEKLIDVIEALLHPETGCPWDLEQTHESLLKYLIEESYEFIEAVEKKDSTLMNEEIGDILLQVLLHATIAKKDKRFDLETIAKTLREKMVRRHPHVFSEKQNLSSDEVLSNWQDIKNKEKKSEKKYSIPHKLIYAPALTSSYKIGQKSTAVNFDWENYSQVMGKVEEEWQEVKSELPPTGKYNKERVEEELGDLLFSVAQLARHLDIDPEAALKKANLKFLRRFHQVEDYINSQARNIQDCSQEELEEAWVKVKKNEIKE